MPEVRFGLHAEYDEARWRQGTHACRLSSHRLTPIGAPAVHNIRLRVVQARNRGCGSVWSAACLKDLTLELRAVLAKRRPLSHPIRRVHIIHCGHNACWLKSNQDDFAACLLRKRLLREQTL